MQHSRWALWLFAALCWMSTTSLAAQDIPVGGEPSGSGPVDGGPIAGGPLDPDTPEALQEAADALNAAELERENALTRARLDAVLIVRLADELEPAQRAAAEAVIDTLPTVLIGENATHAIAPYPALGDIVVLHEIHGAPPFARDALWPSLESDGAMTLAQFYDSFDSVLLKNHAWGLGIAEPVKLGDIQSPDFAKKLREELLRIGRHAALLEYGTMSSDGNLSVCLSNVRAPARYCPHPKRGLDYNQVWHNDSIYLTVESTQTKADYITVMLIDRLGRVTPLRSGRATPYSIGAVAPINEDTPADSPASETRLFLGFDTAINSPQLTPGHYDLLVLATEEPIPASVWERGFEPSALDAPCPANYSRGLCAVMQLQKGTRPLGTRSATGLFRIGIMGDIPAVAMVTQGSPASKSVSLWQAQLFRYRKVQSESASGRSVYNFKSAHKCGGAYLGDGFVLTAAHCVPKNVSEMRVRLGTRDITSGGATFKVSGLVQHTRGNAGKERVDLALLKLDATRSQLARLGDNIAPIRPSTDPNRQFSLLSGLTVTGWGFTKPRLPGETGWLAADGSVQIKAEELQQLVLVPANMRECTGRNEYRAYLAQDMLCLRGVVARGDTCAGDSGGPVTSRMNGGRRLVGIVSTGIGCAFKGLPAVYVNVAQHRQWIARAKRKLLTSPRGYYEMK